MALTRHRAHKPMAALALLVATVYYAAVAVLLLAHRDLGVRPEELGSTPIAVANGQLERLLSSGMAVDGPLAGLQFAAGILVAGLLVVRHGAGAWCWASLSGHVGSALLTEGGIVLLVTTHVVGDERVAAQPDFGISCVLAGNLGALVAGAALRRSAGRGGRDDRAVLLAGLFAAAAFVPFSFGWYGSSTRSLSDWARPHWRSASGAGRRSPARPRAGG